MPIFFGRAGSYQKPKNTSADQLVTFRKARWSSLAKAGLGVSLARRTSVQN